MSKKTLFVILIIIIALVTGLLLALLYFALRHFDVSVEKLRTIMFIVVAVDSLFFSLSIKNLKRPIWQINLFSNKYLIFALILSLGALFAALTIPVLQTLLSLEPFSVSMLFLIVGLGIINVLIIETIKHYVFRGVR